MARSYSTKRSYKRRPAKRSWYNKKYSAQQLAVKAWKATKYLKGLVNSEMMHKDTNFSATTITNTGSITNLVPLAQGDGIADRTGNSILLRSLTYRYKLEVSSAVTLDTSICAMIFFDTQQVSDSAPSVTDILSSSAPESLMALSTGGRFKLLSRKTIILTPASGGRPALEQKGYFNIQKHVRWNGTASTDIQKNGLYLLLISSENTNYPTITGSFRIGYHDN